MLQESLPNDQQTAENTREKIILFHFEFSKFEFSKSKRPLAKHAEIVDENYESRKNR